MNIPLAAENMLAEIDGSIGWMTFNNPGRRNAVSLDMWETIPVILDRFEHDPAVRVVVLRTCPRTTDSRRLACRARILDRSGER